MKKGLLSMALILAMVLTLTLFSRNKAEAFNGGYVPNASPSVGFVPYGGPSGGYGYAQPYGVYGYAQPSGGYGYAQPYVGYGYGQPYSGYGYSTYGGGFYGYAAWGGLYGYAPVEQVGTEGGVIIVPARVGEPGPPILAPGPEVLPPGSNPPQNPPQPGPVNIYPPPMPQLGIGFITYPRPGTMLPPRTGPITYPIYPPGPERLWTDFPVMPSSPPMYPQTPAFPPNPYWPNVNPTILSPNLPGRIPIPR